MACHAPTTSKSNLFTHAIMPLLTIAIINFNTAGLLQDCLHHLLTLPEAPDLIDQIIVVDNASSDGSAAMVRANFPTVHLLALAENRGLTVASNLALQATRSDFLLYLGADAFPQPGALRGLVDYMIANQQVGIATAQLRLRDGTIDMDAHRGFPTPWASLTHFSGLNKLFPHSPRFNQYFLGGQKLDEPHAIDLCISHFMMTRRSMFDEIGGWDEEFFLYGEDVDLCYRAKAAGYAVMYLPQFTVLHYKGASVGVRKQTSDLSSASAATKLRVTKLSTEAMARFYRKHLFRRYPRPVSWVILGAIRILGNVRLWRLQRRLRGKTSD